MNKNTKTVKEGRTSELKNATGDKFTDKCIDDDGEDLPDNFFDDFSDQDFMEGLNVVDDWNDDDETNELSDEKKVKVEKSSGRRREERPGRGRREYRYEARVSYRRREEERKRSRSHYRRSRSRNQKRQESNKKRSEERETSDDRRRDPEKTKRDIQRYKARCAKDLEARVFQEQLKIAETGLVPPGTELDVVLSSEKFKPEEDASKEKSIVKKIKPEEKIIKAVVTDKKKEESLKNKPSPINHSRRRPMRRSLSRERSYSPKRRRRSPHSHERDRVCDVSEVDLRYRIREKRERYMTGRSPLSHRRRTRSPSPQKITEIEREKREQYISSRGPWLRERKRIRSNRLSRSLSPIDPFRIRDVSPRKKFSFMEEIEIKLRQNPPVNDPNLFDMSPNIPQLMNVPVSTPTQLPLQSNSQLYVGHPSNMFPPAMCPPPEQFQQPIILGGDPNLMPQMFIPNAPMFPHHVAQFNVPQPVSASPIYIDHNKTPPIQNFGATNASAINVGVQQENKDLTKLFEDKKITLSDFLSVSAKPLDPSAPVDIHNKIRVISRCQEAIKLLEDPMLVGRFIPRISQQAIEAEKRAIDSAKSACPSPLRKVVVSRFNFTVPVSKRGTNKSLDPHSSRRTLHKIMCLMGIDDQQNILSPVSQESPNQETASVPILEIAPIASPATEIKRILPSKPKTHNMSIQTKPVICNICEIRNSREYSDGQTQTVEKTTCTVSTQVSVEDLTKSCTTFIPRGILKSSTTTCKSISHLTPAQLLAQLDAEKKEDSNKSGMKKETFPYGRSYSDSTNPNSNSYNDNFMWSDNNSNSNNYGINKSTGNTYLPDRFTGNMSNVSGGLNNMARNTQFSGQSTSNSRAFMADNYSSQGRPFQDSGPGPNLRNWNNTSIGRGSMNQQSMSNPRGFGNTQNKFFNQRGPN